MTHNNDTNEISDSETRWQKKNQLTFIEICIFHRNQFG